MPPVGMHARACTTRVRSARDACPARHTHTPILFICTLSQYVSPPPTCVYLQDPQPWQVCDFHPLSFSWRAGNHSAFWGMTLDEGIRYRLGTIRPSSSVTSMNEIHVSPSLPTILPSPHGLGPQGPCTLCPVPPRA